MADQYEIVPLDDGSWRVDLRQEDAVKKGAEFEIRREAIQAAREANGTRDLTVSDENGRPVSTVRQYGPLRVVLLRPDGSEYGELDHAQGTGGYPQYVNLTPAPLTDQAREAGVQVVEQEVPTMANFVSNITKGRIIELLIRVDNNDPTNSAIVLVPLSASDTEANTQDFDDLSAFLGGTPNEQTTSWTRKTLTDTELSAPAVDDTNNRFPGTLPAVTWTAPTTGNNTTGLAVCYDSDTTAGTDANILWLTHNDFSVTADGNDVILNSGDFVRAT